MKPAIDITAVVNGHAEGVLAGPTIVSFERAIAVARESGLAVEGLIVLDRPDAATLLQFKDVGSRHRVLITDHGDPGPARNSAVDAAKGQYVAFLDGDDLWSEDWLAEAHRVCAQNPQTTVAHSEVDVIFGRERVMFWHVDSLDPTFEADFLRYGNYWDAMSFAARSIFRKFPFADNDLRRGFGHEDWHWNCVTLAAGIHHRPVAGTVHFKRRRAGSQSAHANAADSIPWVCELTSYEWADPPSQQAPAARRGPLKSASDSEIQTK
jgi:glycosyltransferase involved in cell wall biosynthesis